MFARVTPKNSSLKPSGCSSLVGNRPLNLPSNSAFRRNQLYKWAEELTRKGGDEAITFNGPRGRPSVDQLSEIDRLKRELKKVTEERDILKKAAAYFARELP